MALSSRNFPEDATFQALRSSGTTRNAESNVYNAQDSLTESTENHYVRNVGSVNAHFMGTYLIAHGQPRRIDEPPPCATDAGLE